MHRRALLTILALAVWSQPGECQYNLWHAIDEAFVVCPPLPKPNPLPDGMTDALWPTRQEYPVTIAYDHGLAEDQWHVVTFFRQTPGRVNITFDVKDAAGQTVIENTTVNLGVEAPSNCTCTGDNGRVDVQKHGANYGKTCGTWDSVNCATWNPNSQTGSWCCDAWCYVPADCKDAQSSIFNPGAYYSYTGACAATPDASPCGFADYDPCACKNVDTVPVYANSGRAIIEGAGYGASCNSWSYERACHNTSVIPANMSDIWCCQDWCWIESGECESAIESELYPGIYWSRAKCPDDDKKVETCPWKAGTSEDPPITTAAATSTCACLGWAPTSMTGGRRRVGRAWPSNYGATCAAHDKDYCAEYFPTKTTGIWCCQQWCYVDEDCASANPSIIAIGAYWSYEACPDNIAEMQNCKYDQTICDPSTTPATGLPTKSPAIPSNYGVGCGTWDKDNCWTWWAGDPEVWGNATTNHDWCCQSWTWLEEGCPLGVKGMFGKSYSYPMCTDSGPLTWNEQSRTCVTRRLQEEEEVEVELAEKIEKFDEDIEEPEQNMEEHEQEDADDGHEEEDADEELEEDYHEEGEEEHKDTDAEREEDEHEEGLEENDVAEEERVGDGHEDAEEDDDGEGDMDGQSQGQVSEPNLRAFASERALAPARRRGSSSSRRSPSGRRRASTRISVPDYRRRAAVSSPPARRRQPASVPSTAPRRRRSGATGASVGRRRQGTPRPTPQPTPRPTPPPTPTPAPASAPRRRRSPAPPPAPEGRRRTPTAARRRANITPATSTRRRQPGGSAAYDNSRRRQVGADGRTFEAPRRRRTPAGSSPPASASRRRASVGYTNTNTMTNNYNGQMPSKTAYGHTGVAKPAGSTAKIALAAGAGVAGGMLLGAGAYYTYSRYNQDVAVNGAGASMRDASGVACKVPQGPEAGKLIRCDDCENAGFSVACTKLSACYGDDGCDYTLTKQTLRDDIMTASFLPSEWVGPLTITIYNITGATYTPANVCPPLPNQSTLPNSNTVDPNWLKAASVNIDLYVTFSEVGAALDQSSETCLTDTKVPCSASRACGTNEACVTGFCECRQGWCLSTTSTIPSCSRRDSASTSGTFSSNQDGASLLLLLCLLAMTFLRGRIF